MYPRFARAAFIVAALLLGLVSPAAAHPGHTHRVLGTVTMAAADHVMLKDVDGKDVTVMLAKDTKIVRGGQPATVEDIKPGLRVAITAMVEKKGDTEVMTAKTIELAKG